MILNKILDEIYPLNLAFRLPLRLALNNRPRRTPQIGLPFASRKAIGKWWPSDGSGRRRAQVENRNVAMQAKKFLAGLVLVGFVLSAGILGTSKDAEAFTVPFAIHNGASNDFSATLDMTISNGTAVLKITNTSNPTGAAGQSSIGAIWLEKGLADLFGGGLINNGPGVSFNPHGSGPQPPGYLSGADNPWEASRGFLEKNPTAPENI